MSSPTDQQTTTSKTTTPADASDKQATASFPARNEWMQQHGWFWIGGAGLMFFAFVTFSLVINSNEKKPGPFGEFSDYSHEIASAVLGSILTLAFTALLLRAQERSTAELQRLQAHAERDRENGAKILEENRSYAVERGKWKSEPRA